MRQLRFIVGVTALNNVLAGQSMVPAMFSAALGAVIACTAPAHGSLAASPKDLRTHVTLHSIGIEWDIEGDANHNASAKVEFRRSGSEQWRRFYNLFRVDYQGWWRQRRNLADRHYNMLAGSIMFLTPGTEYEVRLTLDDPDSGSATERFTIRTRPIPQAPAGGRELHVKPGGGGGKGTAADPLLGIAAADAQTRPGDILMLHGGDYGQPTVNTDGEVGRYIVWKAAGSDRVILEGITVNADHIWLEGLTIRNTRRLENGLTDKDGHEDVVVTRNQFHGFNYSLRLEADSRDWHIADNVLVGDKPADPMPAGEAPGQLRGEGIELNHSSGHVVAYNRISQSADGVSYPQRNCDIYGNDISIMTDDGLEPDYGYANNRMWGNRLTHCSNFFFSFQPMYCGPWYIIRNLCSGQGRTYKFNGPTDRFMTAHNTFVIGGRTVVTRASALLTSVSRNNLYINADGGEMWNGRPWGSVGDMMHENNFVPNWKTDVDYDGFDFGEFKPGDPLFTWDDKTYSDLREFAASAGIERNAVLLETHQVFANYQNPAQHLELKSISSAVDAGDAMPGINDDFEGDGPDLGAYELGKPLPHYGPRDEQTMRKHSLYWAKW